MLRTSRCNARIEMPSSAASAMSLGPADSNGSSFAMALSKAGTFSTAPTTSKGTDARCHVRRPGCASTGSARIWRARGQAVARDASSPCSALRRPCVRRALGPRGGTAGRFSRRPSFCGLRGTASRNAFGGAVAGASSCWSVAGSFCESAAEPGERMPLFRSFSRRSPLRSRSRSRSPGQTIILCARLEGELRRKRPLANHALARRPQKQNQTLTQWAARRHRRTLCPRWFDLCWSDRGR